VLHSLLPFPRSRHDFKSLEPPVAALGVDSPPQGFFRPALSFHLEEGTFTRSILLLSPIFYSDPLFFKEIRTPKPLPLRIFSLSRLHIVKPYPSPADNGEHLFRPFFSLLSRPFWSLGELYNFSVAPRCHRRYPSPSLLPNGFF